MVDGCVPRVIVVALKWNPSGDLGGGGVIREITTKLRNKIPNPKPRMIVAITCIDEISTSENSQDLKNLSSQLEYLKKFLTPMVRRLDVVLVQNIDAKASSTATTTTTATSDTTNNMSSALTLPLSGYMHNRKVESETIARIRSALERPENSYFLELFRPDNTAILFGIWEIEAILFEEYASALNSEIYEKMKVTIDAELKLAREKLASASIATVPSSSSYQIREKFRELIPEFIGACQAIIHRHFDVCSEKELMKLVQHSEGGKLTSDEKSGIGIFFGWTSEERVNQILYCAKRIVSAYFGIFKLSIPSILVCVAATLVVMVVTARAMAMVVVVMVQDGSSGGS
eukprot:TRINITY_DN7520_c0_g1_i3.p1 TRINITY_DN7520_c0_g1~~TRINITY_DN7520_c0_g1_i3.p1  ORF type:complete len:345 (-),score=80.30 TRINITY_DN7520_c0_g1_i3:1195-2229(-)